MPVRTLKILGIHGLGDHRNTTWEADWRRALEAAFPGQSDLRLDCSFLTYDHIFENVEIDPWESTRAVWRLAMSGVSSVFGGQRGVVRDIPDRVRWTAGYVVAWLEDEAFKRQTRKLVLDTVADLRPDLILAHSLGSLVSYNAFTHDDASRPAVRAALRRLTYVSLGSQLGNPFVTGTLASGRLQPLPVRQWYHLFNKEDDVFTAPIRLWEAANFRQVDTFFDIAGLADHSAVEYLTHVNTVENVWRPLAERRIHPRSFGAAAPRARASARAKAAAAPRRRALLVGINDYPNEDDRLEGCVNDVFLMSSVLQECGFPPEHIRVCLDRRATARGITDRLEWLLDDPRPGDELVFYYSGHGARIPEYGADFEPDHHTETLVPWDFDWSPERAVADDQIYGFYSQLPYETRLMMILDCCHSGGMHRQGGAKVRGLNPPDDVRHRELQWNVDEGMWEARGMSRLNAQFSSQPAVNQDFFGKDGTSARFGRASFLRRQPEAEYRRVTRRSKTTAVGPYLPLIIEACREEEFSYEYRHGVTSYGAFTYSMAQILRQRRRISFDALVAAATDKLRRLGYSQEPQILGPKAIRRRRVPWARR